MSAEETASALLFSEWKETHLGLVNGQMGAIGPPKTLFIQKCQVFLRRQVFSLQESVDGRERMSSSRIACTNRR